MTTESTYIPGMCNINTAEVAYRRKAMWFGVGLSVALFAALLLFDAPWWLSAAILFVPVYIAAIGYLQVRNRFCVSYGAKGQQNADEDSTEALVVSEAESLQADKAKARRMNVQALIATIAILAICAIIAALV